MKHACAYSIVQFRPFVETGEFANVGVVLLCAEGRYVNFKLLKRYARVTQFFKELDAAVYLRAMQMFKDEMTRFCSVLKREALDGRKRSADVTLAEHAFAELTRPREGLLRFSEPRLALADNPATKLDDLYDFHVGRNFATPEYQERLLENHIGKLLRHAHLNFVSAKVGDEHFNIRFPFVRLNAQEQAQAIIKPLYLAQEEPTKIITKGGSWVDRIERLKRRGNLPHQVLFALSAPPESAEKRYSAFLEIRDDLEKKGVSIVPANDDAHILQFADRVN